MRLTVKRRAPIVACAQQQNADIPGSDPMRTP